MLTPKQEALLKSTLRCLVHIEMIRREEAFQAPEMDKELRQELNRLVEYNNKGLSRIFNMLTAREGAGRSYMATNDEKLCSMANIMALMHQLPEETCALIETELLKQPTKSYEPAA